LGCLVTLFRKLKGLHVREAPLLSISFRKG
jgi:hypothetical protein